MENKKHLAWFVDFEHNNLNRLVVGNSLLINKICEEFEKIYFIGIQNLKFFSKKKKIDDTIDKNLKLPNNIEIFNPLDSKDFKNFMIGKKLLGINSFARGFLELKARFLLMRLKIRQVQINNCGNIQTNLIPVKKFFWKGVLRKISHDYAHKITVLLSNLGLVSKMEIRFTSDPDFLKYKKKGKGLLKKIFNYFNFHYAKELILVNSQSFDEARESKFEINEDQIVVLDDNFNDPQFTAWRGIIDEKKLEKHYYYLKKLVINLSNICKKKIVICIHPCDNLELKKKYFPDFEVVQNKTRENIFKALIVLFCDSSAIIDAIFLKKKIITFTSDVMDINQLNCASDYARRVGLLKINIQDEMNINKDDFLHKLDIARENYSDYIKSNITPDGNNISYKKIIKILKERFFN